MGTIVEREEFDHLINEFEVFKDSVLDEITKLVQDIEIVKEEITQIRTDASSNVKENKDKKRLP
jgi:hypothetical protein